MLILGIETSCDETAASVVEMRGGFLRVLSSVTSSQASLHARWGGVVPNLAAREHLRNILPVIEIALGQSGIQPKNIGFIAVTSGPGLIPALLIGSGAAKILSYRWQKPLLGIHHIEGHIYANFISSKTGASQKLQISNSGQNQNFQSKETEIFPILCLVVSGGHTQLILMRGHLKYEIIGQTLDDAAGEAFDKVARILNLGYPGGPAIAARATEFKIQNSKKTNSRMKIELPRPMLNSRNFNFSFSGLKTAVLYAVKKRPEILKNKFLTAGMAHEFQQAVIEVLAAKTMAAARKYNPKAIMLAGGVSANKKLRKHLEEQAKKNFPGIRYLVPDIGYSVDNAAMIAAAGFFRWQKMSAKDKKKARSNWKNLEAEANLGL